VNDIAFSAPILVGVRTYRIASVRRDRQEGREHIVLADLLNDEGAIVLSGTLAHVIALCEERGYSTSNLEQAKVALSKMS